MKPPEAPSAAPLLAAAGRLLLAGRPGEAILPLRRAEALRPADTGISHDLGLACLEAGRVEEAIAAFRRAVAGNARYTDAWFRLGLALERHGEAGAAIVAYDRATALLPSMTEAWFRAGALVFTLGHREEAIGCFRRAAATGPKTSFGRLGHARALLAEDRDADAERVLRRALALDPGLAMAHDLLGNLLADAGRFEEASESFARAIGAAPSMAGSYYDLVRCRKITSADGALTARMESALATPGLEAGQRLRIHLALGKAADDQGLYGRAMHHFDAADATRAAARAFDSAEFDRQVDALITRLTPEAMARAQSPGASAKPVLIVGMPRSGTTLVEQIISSHRDVAAGGELNFWNERGAEWLAGKPGRDEAAFLQRAAADYLKVLQAIGPKALRITDKMPFNFLWAGLVHLALPGATIIHCRRAAIDVAISIHQTHFNQHLAFPTGGDALVAYFSTYRRVTEHWRKNLPADRFIEVEYEALTAAPEAAIRRLVAACGLDWDDACLRPERNLRVVKTPSRWQARQPINRNSVERWRQYEPWLGALRKLLPSPCGGDQGR